MQRFGKKQQKAKQESFKKVECGVIRTRALTSSERSSKDAKGAGPMRFCLLDEAAWMAAADDEDDVISGTTGKQ